jgi:putative transcriptional regulator
MKQNMRSDSFTEQMARSMAEMKSIMSAGESPTGDGRLTVRTIRVAEPGEYDAKRIKKVRAVLNVSQAVFARLIGVSDVLVRSWERGARNPAPVARRLLDQIRAHPSQFVQLVQNSPIRKSNGRVRGGFGKRDGRRAA